jgi:hypothetical protein
MPPQGQPACGGRFCAARPPPNIGEHQKGSMLALGDEDVRKLNPFLIDPAAERAMLFVDGNRGQFA